MFSVADFNETYSTESALVRGIEENIRKMFPGERHYDMGVLKKMDERTLVLNVRMPSHTYAVWIDVV